METRERKLVNAVSEMLSSRTFSMVNTFCFDPRMVVWRVLDDGLAVSASTVYFSAFR